MGTVVSTATTNFNKLLVDLVQKELEKELRAPLPHLLPGNFVKGEFVKGTNNTMRYLRVADMPVVTGTPTLGVQPWLAEGTPPAVTEDLAITFEEYSAWQAGRVIKLTDKALLQSPIDMLAVAAEKIARNSVETADQYVADIIGAGTQATLMGGKASRNLLTNTDVVTGQAIRRAAAQLKASNVPTFADGYYRCILNPATTFDIQSDTAVGGWLDANRYAGSMPLFTGEIGRFAGVRFIESAKAKVFTGAGAAGINVYSTVVFGPGAYAFGDWGTIESHITPPGGQADPLHQTALVGWKGYFGAKLLIAAGPRYVRLESGSGI